ncbi:MAG: amidase [Alphaproteobacteria bacterium]|nr:amidase [Alphaproteobacteria bacterium]
MTLIGRTIESVAADLAAGKTTSRALVEAALASIAADGAAFTLVSAERARIEADASDRLRKAGVVPSPLAGVPISIKDLFDVAGETTAAGSALLRDAPAASRDAPPVARLRAAGAVIVGRTHMSEFAFSGLGANPHYARCANPHDAARVPGGSSSGAAVSVARGQAAMGLGTDTGGSTRIPPSFCGVVGFKPTQARVTRDGAFPLSESLDSIGPIANSVACCALVDRVIADAPTMPHPVLGIAGLRLAVPTNFVLDAMDAVVARAFDRVLSRLADAGARIERLRVPGLARIPEINARGTVANAEAFAYHTRAGLLKRREGYDPNVVARIEVGGRMTASDYLDLLHARAGFTAEVDRLSAPYDALLSPTTPCVAPLFDEIADQAGFARANALALRNPSVVNFLDRCALSVPMHLGGELPSGLMIVGERLGDARLLAIGRAVETVLRG